MQPITNYDPTERRRHRRRARLRIWNRIVLVIGYIAIAYELARGVIYLLILAEEWIK